MKLIDYPWYVGDVRIPDKIVAILGSYYVIKNGREYYCIHECEDDDVPILEMSEDSISFELKSGKVMLELASKKELSISMLESMKTYGGTLLPWIIYDDAIAREFMSELDDEFKEIILQSYFNNEYIRDISIDIPVKYKLKDGTILKIENEGICEYINNGVDCSYPSTAIFLYHDETRDWVDTDKRQTHIQNLIRPKLPTKKAT